MKVREYSSEDCEKIVKLFYDTVHSVNAADYTEIQLNAWAPENIDLVKWDNKLSNNYSVVAEENNIIIGFGDIDITGYFDHLYIHKDYQRMGVATLIADIIEDYICDKGIKTITTDASITAKPFFEKRGYIVRKAQIVETRGQFLNNFKMQKTFS